jgi:hypothetical protein
MENSYHVFYDRKDLVLSKHIKLILRKPFGYHEWNLKPEAFHVKTWKLHQYQSSGKILGKFN